MTMGVYVSVMEELGLVMVLRLRMVQYVMPIVMEHAEDMSRTCLYIMMKLLVVVEPIVLQEFPNVKPHAVTRNI